MKKVSRNKYRNVMPVFRKKYKKNFKNRKFNLVLTILLKKFNQSNPSSNYLKFTH